MKKILPPVYGALFNLISYFSPALAARLSFGTFSKVRKGKILPQQAPFLQAVISEKIAVEGHDIQTYHWKGQKQTVLLVHGWESNTHRWRNLITFLREHNFDIRAFDAPGHGYSSGTYLHVPLYGNCLRHMIQRYKPSYVVGHSVGGLTALYVQSAFPEKTIEKIVTIGAPSEFHEILEHYRQLLYLNPRVMDALEKYILERFGLQVREFSGSAFARSIKSKGLILHDKLDTVAPFHASEQIHREWRHSELVATEGLGHSMHQEAVNKKIIDFLIN